MIDPLELYNKAMNAAEKWADKEHAFGILEDGLDTLEGQLIAEYKSRGEAVTNLSKLVKANQRWVEMAELVRDAKKEALVAKLKYEQINRFQDNIRTKESTERALAR